MINIFRIDTIEQFVQANLQWGKTGQPPPFADFFDLTVRYFNQNDNFSKFTLKMKIHLIQLESTCSTTTE